MRSGAVFVLIRDGEQSFFDDLHATPTIDRELIWGPEAFTHWVEQGEKYDDWEDDANFIAGAIVDLDRKTVLWCVDNVVAVLPRAESAMDRLIEAAWTGYQVVRCFSVADLARQLGLRPEQIEDYAEQTEEALSRSETVQQILQDDWEDEEEYENDEEEENDSEEMRAWITIIEPTGKVHHRELPELPWDLICGHDFYHSIEALMQAPEVETPAESVVREGLMIDMVQRQIQWWGGLSTRTAFENAILEDGDNDVPLLPRPSDAPDHKVEESGLLIWPGWNVLEATHGYQQHCAAAGPEGSPLSEAQVVARIAPWILSTKRIDMEMIVGLFGGALKKTAIRMMGCLTAILCLPVVLFTMFSGNWKAGGITVVALIATAVIVFKVLESKVKKKIGGTLSSDDPQNQQRKAAAGPMDPAERQKRFDKLLATANMPGYAEIKPHIDSDMSKLLSVISGPP